MASRLLFFAVFTGRGDFKVEGALGGLPWKSGARAKTLPSVFTPKMSPLAIAVCKKAVQVNY